jgi:hypothetical protein
MYGPGILPLQEKDYDKRIGVGMLDQRCGLMAMRIIGRQQELGQLGHWIQEKDSVGDVIGSSLWRAEKSSGRPVPAWRLGAWPAMTIIPDTRTKATGGGSRSGGGGFGGGQGGLPIGGPFVANSPLIVNLAIPGSRTRATRNPHARRGYVGGFPFVACRPALKQNSDDGFWELDNRFEQKLLNFIKPATRAYPVRMYPSGYRGLVISGNEEKTQEDIFVPVDDRLIAMNGHADPAYGTLVCDVVHAFVGTTASLKISDIDPTRAVPLQSIFRVLKGINVKTVQTIEGTGSTVHNSFSWNGPGSIALQLGESEVNDCSGGLLYEYDAGLPSSERLSMAATLSHRRGGPFCVGTDLGDAGGGKTLDIGGDLKAREGGLGFTEVFNQAGGGVTTTKKRFDTGLREEHVIGRDVDGTWLTAGHLSLNSLFKDPEHPKADGPLNFDGFKTNGRVDFGPFRWKVTFEYDQDVTHVWGDPYGQPATGHGKYKWFALGDVGQSEGTPPAPIPDGKTVVLHQADDVFHPITHGEVFQQLPLNIHEGDAGLSGFVGIDRREDLQGIQQRLFQNVTPIIKKGAAHVRNYPLTLREISHPSIIFKPQLFIDSVQDFRNYVVPSENEANNCIRDTPITARLDGYGAQTATGWKYGFPPGGASRYLRWGTSTGGICLLPGELSLEDVRDKTVNDPSLVSRAHFIIPPFSRLGFGLPSTMSGDIQTDGIVFQPEEIINPVGVLIRKMKSDGTFAQVGAVKPTGWGFGAAFEDGSGDRVMFIGNAATEPTANPTVGGLLWVRASDGKLRYRRKDGTVTNLEDAAAGTVDDKVVVYENGVQVGTVSRKLDFLGKDFDVTEDAGNDQFDIALAALLDSNARCAVSKNSGATVGTRRRHNFIEGSGVTLTIADDAGNEEVDITIASSGGTDTKVAVFEGGVQVGAVGRRLDFLGADFDVVEDVGNDQFDVALAALLNSNARVAVRKNSTGSVFTRRRLNLIEGTGIGITIVDDNPNEEVDITFSNTLGDTKVAVFEASVQVGTVGRRLNFVGADFDITEVPGSDWFQVALAPLLDETARVLWRQSDIDVAARRSLDFIDTAGIAWVLADTPASEEVEAQAFINIKEVTVAFTDGDCVKRVTISDVKAGVGLRVVATIRRPDVTEGTDAGYVYTWQCTRMASGQFDLVIQCLGVGGDDVTEVPPNETINVEYVLGP